MSTKSWSIVLFVVAAISMFVAWERYEANAAKVRAAQQMMDSSPLGGMMKGMLQQTTGQKELKPSWPATSKYAVGAGLIAAVGGVGLLLKGGSRRS